MTSKEIKRKPESNGRADVSNDFFLILHNDDHHTFNYVIKALIEVCEHGYEQAAQCTVITHYKGKCDIKKGDYRKLKSMKDALTERELNATID